ncbi:hypothetical protein FisN_19Lh170 [Fistulifera solaris]|uniref:Solute carrier family 35 (UDP-galactose transporter), member B1 n=1 Tax=Fistulifera solaris TaxID=1519565 RepID=A0A1Z5J7D7_FISSO|nr:hypothetical protein FisN_19Lh170 [Fistulifera solaris]|eukprot:GAX09701.1 hypothetical protein FisN_19Lh170 [Fistulifera solaris]
MDASDTKQSDATPGLWRLAFCATGICACYLYYGLLFENLFQPGEHALGATFVLMTQSITNSMVAYGWKKFQDSSSVASSATREALPHRFLFAATACYVTAMACSNEAVRYVSYPVAVLAKSCKLIPTMVVGQFVEGRLYSRTEWMAALSISAGIVVFHMTRMEEAIHHDDQPKPTATYGMLLLLVSLTMDGFLASCQNFLKKKRPNLRPPDAIETMLWMNLYAIIYLVPLTVMSGQLDMEALLSMWYKIAALNMTVAAGQVFIFLTITWYSPVMTTTFTTTRKFFTILLSVWTYGHHFSTWQWLAVALVFTGLYLSILMIQKPHGAVEKKKD